MQWFGAIPTVIPDCNPAIDAALALARSVQFHAPIYFPAGGSDASRPIVIPRGPQGTGWQVVRRRRRRDADCVRRDDFAGWPASDDVR